MPKDREMGTSVLFLHLNINDRWGRSCFYAFLYETSCENFINEKDVSNLNSG